MTNFSSLMQVKTIARIVLGSFLCFTGIAHFVATDSFVAQVPKFVPWPEPIIYISGVIEIVLGLLLIFQVKYRQQVGLLTAAFFIAIFPGNISQYLTHAPAFGLDTDFARAARLLFQPVLVVWAIWSTKPQSK